MMYVVKEGEVDLLVGGAAVETVGPDGIFGEMALVDNLPRSATARAKTACKVAPISEREFQFMVDETPFFALKVIRVLARRLRAMNERRS
jgi:CRP/FNR family cyclic AMP-dependent transcriptional regulator